MNKIIITNNLFYNNNKCFEKIFKNLALYIIDGRN